MKNLVHPELRDFFSALPESTISKDTVHAIREVTKKVSVGFSQEMKKLKPLKGTYQEE